MDTERREFIKRSCSLCASLIGLVALAPLAQSCSPLLTIKTDVKQGSILVMRSNFTAENKIVLIKNASFEFDIALVQLGPDEFKAIEMKCSHQANSLVPTKNGFFCNAHGSSFTLEGKVKNPPATGNLKEYKVEITADTVNVIV